MELLTLFRQLIPRYQSPSLSTALIFLLLVCSNSIFSAWAQTTKYRGHPTDTLTSGGDNARSGYLDNHNIDPEVVGGGGFGVLWRKRLLGDYMGFTEQIYAQPLVFTPPGPDSRQQLYIISEQNHAYILDAANGTILVDRRLAIPFLTKDLDGCNDISDCVGSTSTGVIDPETGTWYVTTKTYSDQGKIGVAQGLKEGRVFVHALDTMTLESKKGFPVSMEGLEADNAPWRRFEGGKHNQRPALLQVGEWVYAGFGSHCVQWNFTGWVIGWHRQSGEIVAKYAMEGGRETTTGIGGGIWMSGAGIASDNPGRMYFATGNGYASQLADDPIPGRSPPTALEEAVVNMVINDDGSLVPVDFFMPWEKRDLDAMDKDLGTSGFVLLPPGVFSTPTKRRIGCVGGKTGKLYFLDLEDLGGYQMGPDRKDKVLQTIQMAAPIFSSAAAYPHEGGYIYVTPVGKQTVVYKFNVNSAGLPVFTQAGVTVHSAAGRQGVGHSTVSSNKGKPGSGILWITDVEGINLRAYAAEPVGGVLPVLYLANNPGQSKFSRPTFSDGRVHLTTSTGYVTTFGSPVNMPLNCSAPYDAGSVVIGESSATVVTCVAKIPVTVNNITLDSSTTPPQFSVFNVSETLPKELLVNQMIRFSVSFKPTTVGPLSTSAIVRTTNRNSGELYSPTTPVLIRGIARSLQPILTVQPDVLSFGELITGSGETSVLDFALQNAGEGALNISGYSWSSTGPGGPPNLTPVPGPGGIYTVGPFIFRGLPAPGNAIPGNGKADVSVTFSPKADGYFKVYLDITSNTLPLGTKKSVGIFGTAGGPPRAIFSWKPSDSPLWQTYNSNSTSPLQFSPSPLFGTTSPPHTLRLTNTGGTTLTLTISKPPTSGVLAALNGLGSLPEGSQLAPNTSTDASLICSPPKNQVNTDPTTYTAVWTFNTNDATMGKLVIPFLCTAISRQLGPPSKLSTPSSPRGRYRYLGCYKDATPERILDVRLYYSKQTENAKCQTDCLAGGYAYAGTEYEGECWCGKTLPEAKWRMEDEGRCGYLCKGDYRQYCGGDGAYLSLFGDEEKTAPEPSGGGTSTPTPTPTSGAPTTTAGTLTTTATASLLPPSPSPPSPTQTIGNYTHLGCLLEPSSPPGARALTRAYLSLDRTMTNAACVAFCSARGWAYAGTEYGVECWCGDRVENGARFVEGGEAEAARRCSVECAGAKGKGEMCGGGNALTVYRRGT